MELQQFDFTIKHRPGKQNANADALSRTPETECFLLGIDHPVTKWRRLSKSSNGKIQVTIAAFNEEIPTRRKRRIENFNENEAQNPIPYECCGQVICQCQYPDPINWDDYAQSEETIQKYETNNESYDENSGDETTTQSFDNISILNISLEEILERNSTQSEEVADNREGYPNLDTTAYTYTREEVLELYAANLKEKNVVANQPITRGGSKCTDACDTENHHIHTYCKMCKRNLWHGTVIHNCTFGFGSGEIHPEMDPQFIKNKPWWKEPLAVQHHNNYVYLRYLQRLCLGLPFYEFSPSIGITIAELD